MESSERRHAQAHPAQVQQQQQWQQQEEQQQQQRQSQQRQQQKRASLVRYGAQTECLHLFPLPHMFLTTLLIKVTLGHSTVADLSGTLETVV